MGVKLSDIAKKLNLSTSAVSLAINNKPGISAETRQLVLDTCHSMGYKLKPRVSSNNNKKRNIILWIYKKHGLVVSDTPFFSALLEGIDQEASKNGFNTIFSYYTAGQNQPSEIADKLFQQDVLGMLIIATEMYEEDVRPFLDLNIPMVMVDANFSKEKLDSVIIDNYQGAYDMTEYLIKKGHRKIGHIKSSITIKNFEEREDGYKAALAANGIAYEKKYDFCVESTMDGAYRDMADLLSKNRQLPTAFFSDNDIMACGSIKALKDAGIKMPTEVSIGGFDDLPMCELVSPKLTTTRVYKQNFGSLAVDQLIKRIDGGLDIDAHVRISVGTTIIKRHSITGREE